MATAAYLACVRRGKPPHFSDGLACVCACVYLCSSDGDYITGSELMLNGGLYM